MWQRQQLWMSSIDQFMDSHQNHQMFIESFRGYSESNFQDEVGHSRSFQMRILHSFRHLEIAHSRRSTESFSYLRPHCWQKIGGRVGQGVAVVLTWPWQSSKLPRNFNFKFNIFHQRPARTHLPWNFEQSTVPISTSYEGLILRG